MFRCTWRGWTWLSDSPCLGATEIVWCPGATKTRWLQLHCRTNHTYFLHLFCKQFKQLKDRTISKLCHHFDCLKYIMPAYRFVFVLGFTIVEVSCSNWSQLCYAYCLFRRCTGNINGNIWFIGHSGDSVLLPPSQHPLLHCTHARCVRSK